MTCAALTTSRKLWSIVLVLVYLVGLGPVFYVWLNTFSPNKSIPCIYNVIAHWLRVILAIYVKRTQMEYYLTIHSNDTSDIIIVSDMSITCTKIHSIQIVCWCQDCMPISWLSFLRSQFIDDSCIWCLYFWILSMYISVSVDCSVQKSRYSKYRDSSWNLLGRLGKWCLVNENVFESVNKQISG